MRSLEIIKTRFWPVIHYNTMARAAPWSLKTQRQDFLGLELGLWLEEGWGWRRETQGSADSLSRRNPYGKKKKKVQAASWRSVAYSWNTCCVSGPVGHSGDQADLAPILRESHLHGGSRHQIRNTITRMGSAERWKERCGGLLRNVPGRPPSDFELRPEACVGRALRRGGGRGGYKGIQHM